MPISSLSSVNMSNTVDAVLNDERLRFVGWQLLQDGQPVRMRMGGYSMFPVMLPGDVGIISKVPSEHLQKGEVVVVDRGDKWIAHRLVGIQESGADVVFISQGDSIPFPDAPFGQDALRGVIRSVSRGHRTFDPRDGLWVRAVMRAGAMVRPLARITVRTYGLTKAILRRLRRLRCWGISAR